MEKCGKGRWLGPGVPQNRPTGHPFHRAPPRLRTFSDSPRPPVLFVKPRERYLRSAHLGTREGSRKNQSPRKRCPFVLLAVSSLSSFSIPTPSEQPMLVKPTLGLSQAEREVLPVLGHCFLRSRDPRLKKKGVAGIYIPTHHPTTAE